MSTATISSKGQLTIPKEVRTALDLHPGDRVSFIRMEDGHYALVPATQSVMTLKGILRKPRRAVTLEEMDRAIAEGASGS